LNVKFDDIISPRFKLHFYTIDTRTNIILFHFVIT